MFRIVLQDFSVSDRLQDLVQADLFFRHLLLCVLRDPYVSAFRPGLDAEE
jgi:hypothetical protein